MSGTPGSVLCHECGKVLSSKRSLARHLADVHGVKPKYACPHCGLEAESSRHLREHVTEFHGQARRHRCETCGRMFARRRHLTQHVANVHQGRRDFECTICEQTFTQRGHLHEHIRRRHLEELGKAGGVVRSLTRRRSEMGRSGTSAESESENDGATSSRSGVVWPAAQPMPLMPAAAMALAGPAGSVHVPRVSQWQPHGSAPIRFQASLGGQPSIPPPPPMPASSLVPPVATLGDRATMPGTDAHRAMDVAPAARAWASTPAAAALPLQVQAQHLPMPQPAPRPYATGYRSEGHLAPGPSAYTVGAAGAVSVGPYDSSKYYSDTGIYAPRGYPAHHHAGMHPAHHAGMHPAHHAGPGTGDDDDDDDDDGRGGVPIRLPRTASTVARRFSLSTVPQLAEAPQGTVPYAHATRELGMWMRGGADAAELSDSSHRRPAPVVQAPEAVVAAHPWLRGHDQARPAPAGPAPHRDAPSSAQDLTGRPYGQASAGPSSFASRRYGPGSGLGSASLGQASHAAPPIQHHRPYPPQQHHQQQQRAAPPAGFAPYQQPHRAGGQHPAPGSPPAHVLPYPANSAPVPPAAFSAPPYPPAGVPLPPYAGSSRHFHTASPFPRSSGDRRWALPGAMPPSTSRITSVASDVAVAPAAPLQWRLGPKVPYIHTEMHMTTTASSGFVSAETSAAGPPAHTTTTSGSVDAPRPASSKSADDTGTTGDNAVTTNGSDSGKQPSERNSSRSEDDHAFSITSRSGVSNEALLSSKHCGTDGILGAALGPDAAPAPRPSS